MIFLKDALDYVSKQSSKISVLMGDLNIDLVKYASDSNTGKLYDLLCSHSFSPLILQPSMVTSKTATLIDNIFINDISCHSQGGNITSSISDHYFQFCQTDIVGSCKHVMYTCHVNMSKELNIQGISVILISTNLKKNY